MYFGLATHGGVGSSHASHCDAAAAPELAGVQDVLGACTSVARASSPAPALAPQYPSGVEASPQLA